MSRGVRFDPAIGLGHGRPLVPPRNARLDGDEDQLRTREIVAHESNQLLVIRENLRGRLAAIDIVVARIQEDLCRRVRSDHLLVEMDDVRQLRPTEATIDDRLAGEGLRR